MEGFLCRYELCVSQSTTETGETLETALLMILDGSDVRSNHKQELFSVYKFLDVLYNLCSLVAL